jgi:hypothetical protein
MDPDKREIRQLKRKLKQLGNQRLRRQVRRTLAEDPAAAHEVEPDFGRFRTAELNGYDHDATRRRHLRPAVESDADPDEGEPPTDD